MDILLLRSRLALSAQSMWQWAVQSRIYGTLIAFCLVAVIATLDYRTGYEIRLAILYLLPIALATWSGGIVSGLFVSVAATTCWGISFKPNHIYSREVFYYWEGLLLVTTFLIFVTLLHRLRTTLSLADARFLHVLNGLSAGIYVTDKVNGKLLYANQYCADILRTELNPETVRVFENRLVSLDSGRPRSMGREEVQPQFSSQEARDERTGNWYLIQSTPIRWVNNEHVNLRIVMNITEQKQASALKRQHLDMLHNTARSAVLAEIASMLGHEINQPLMAIATYNNASIMLLSKPEPDIRQVVDALEKCRAQTVRAGQIVERTRSFLKRRTPAYASLDMNEVIAKAAQSLELELQESAVDFTMDLEALLPEVMFDRALVEQVIINLLRNAIDAVMQGPVAAPAIVVRTALEESGAVQVSVMDNGPGIAVEDSADIYTPFFTRKPHGLGLGLSICRSIVEAHAGRLWHERTPHARTAFHFTLPQPSASRYAQA